MEKTIQERREEIILKHKEKLKEISPQKRKEDFDYFINFFKNDEPIDFDELRIKGILNK